MIGGQKVIKVFCHEEQSVKDFDKVNEQLFHASANANIRYFITIGLVCLRRLCRLPAAALSGQLPAAAPYMQK